MPLNKNLRTEQFDIDVCGKVAGFYADWFDALWEESERSRDNQAIIRRVYDRFAAKRGSEEETASQADRSRAGRGRAGMAGLEDISMSREEFARMLGD